MRPCRTAGGIRHPPARGGAVQPQALTVRGLFIGAEFGMKVSTQKGSEWEMKVTDEPAVKSTDDNKKVNLQLYAVPSFRIGWTF